MSSMTAVILRVCLKNEKEWLLENIGNVYKKDKKQNTKKKLLTRVTYLVIFILTTNQFGYRKGYAYEIYD